MKQTRFKDGMVVFRQWSENEGLRENMHQFKTLDELFRLCLSSTENQLLERVQITGVDAQGHPRQVTLIFQSLTISEDDI